MDKLVLSYEFDPSHFDKKLNRDDFGRLSLQLETERFSGRGGFWVQWQDVVEFGERLSAYPIDADSPIVAQWGYEMQEGDDLILRLCIGPKNKVGDLLVSVVIADDHEPWHRLSTTFRSGYAALDSFGRDIVKLMNNEADEAVLHGYWRQFPANDAL